MPPEQTRTARLEARIAPDALAVVKRAAEIQGRSVSDFVVAAAQEAAHRTIEEPRHSPLGSGSAAHGRGAAQPARADARSRACREKLSPPCARHVIRGCRFEALAADHDRRAFPFGVAELDRYFQQQVTQDIRRRIANCFVAVESATSHVAAYYTISAASIPLVDLPPEETRRLPRYPTVPAVRMGPVSYTHLTLPTILRV